MANILYLDGDRDLSEIFAGYLREYGFQVRKAEDSRTVMKELTAGHFDLLICDRWSRPEDGHAVCERVRALPDMRMKRIPILMVGPEEPRAEEHKWTYLHDVYFLIKFKSAEDWYQKITTLLNNRVPS